MKKKTNPLIGKKDKKSASSHKNKDATPQEKHLKKIVLSYMSAQNDKAFSPKDLIAATGIWKDQSVESVRAFLERLAGEGKVTSDGDGKYQYKKEVSELLIGKIEITRSGAGFLLIDEGQDIFISQNSLGMAMNGDTVEVRISSRKRRSEGRREGDVVRIVERSRSEFVGTIQKGPGNTYFFLPDDSRVNTDFFIPQDKLMGATHGEKVQVHMTGWTRKAPDAEVIRVLGMAGQHNTEMHAILLQFGFEVDFPTEVEAEADRISDKIPAEEIARRRDFRGITTLTIDPIDAKDFDDALSFQVLPDGNYEVGVHIADVSHYVKPGSPLDKEAYKRATSVYLVDRTVPMLPEKLSNHVCSLRPLEEKCTFSAVFKMNSEGEILEKWIGRTVILSDHRFHYEEAQQVIDGVLDGPYQQELRTMNDLAKKLRSKRMVRGSIEFDTDEVKFVLDENDRPIKVLRKQSFDTNRLIEDFMLLANRTVAAWVKEVGGKHSTPPFVFRVHDHPDPEKMSNLQKFVGAFGYEFHAAEQEDLAGRMNKLLKDVEGKPEQNVVESIAIRAMAKAIYSTKNIGHFGLGFKDYTHFTSPIRRYPDLMVHRLLEKYEGRNFGTNASELEEQCKHCSSMERTAAEAERASIKYKQVEFLKDHFGQEFTGIISGVIEAGFFVELDDNLCEGFVAVRTLNDDYYSLDSDNYCLRGATLGRKFTLGDPVRVKIGEADMQRRKVDMVWLESLSKTGHHPATNVA